MPNCPLKWQKSVPVSLKLLFRCDIDVDKVRQTLFGIATFLSFLYNYPSICPVVIIPIKAINQLYLWPKTIHNNARWWIANSWNPSLTQDSVPYISPSHKSFYTWASPNLTLHETAYFSLKREDIEDPERRKDNIFKLKEKVNAVSEKRERDRWWCWPR